MPAEGEIMRSSVFKPSIAFILATAIVAFGPLASCSRKEGPSLTAYAYDSFISEWGPGPAAIKDFKEKTGIELTIISKGDAGQVLSTVIQEKRAPLADIVIGLDQNLLPKALKAGILAPYASPALSRVSADYRIGKGNFLTPYDYGAFAIIWDRQSKILAPNTLQDLLDHAYTKKLILMDPRTSSPGLGFLSWTLARFGDDWPIFWKALKPNILTIAAGWDAGYGLFLQGEAPMVLSYTTSPAYHLYAEKSERYRALVFPEGHPFQIEGAGLVKNAPHPANAKRFLDYILSDSFQGSVALTNWMYPVAEGIALPECYRVAPRPARIADPSPAALSAALDEWADVASR
jgi:thiamine transport system substrate-binding protein